MAELVLPITPLDAPPMIQPPRRAVPTSDAFGRYLIERHRGLDVPLYLERDDGILEIDGTDYVNGWRDIDSWAVARAAGTVLDVGCGAGRAALRAQQQGSDVTGVDISPGAIEVCKSRGVRDTFVGTLGAFLASRPNTTFDTVLLLGQNLGFLAEPEIRESIDALTHVGSRIIGSSIDAAHADLPEAYRDYMAENVAAGRLPGTVFLRVRYMTSIGRWFKQTYVSPAELEMLTAAGGWSIEEQCGSAEYAVVLVRQ